MVTAAHFRVHIRTVVSFLLLVVVAAIGSRLVDDGGAWVAALKVVTATLAVGLVPGALVTLVWRARTDLSLLEVIGYGVAISFGIVQLLTILAISAHISPPWILILLAGATIPMAAWAFRGSVVLTSSVDELIVLLLVCAFAVPLYLQGSPIQTYEDQVLVGIVRRLSQLDAPRLDNLYVAPNIVYTYPFPAIQYFFALIARLGDVDALFLYHKLRFFWGPVAIVLLYLAARAAFGFASVAAAVAVTAVILACAGVFAMVPSFSWGWGQLATYSYAPDVAMTVLLPALLVMTFAFVHATARRERAFFLSGAAMLVVMLTIVHIREVIQYAAYVGCFLTVTLFLRAWRPYLNRAAVLMGMTVAVAIIYTTWHARAVGVVGDIIAVERANLAAQAAAAPVRDLVFAPASKLFGDFLQYFDTIFVGLFSLLLFAGPTVVMLFRHRPLVWLMSASTLAFLLVMTVPALAAAYIYVTYFEILQIPVRNVIFFLYLFAGALLYTLVVALSRADRFGLTAFVAGVGGGALALFIALTVNQSHGRFFVPLIVGYVLTFVCAHESRGTGGLNRRTAVATVLALLGLVLLVPEREPTPRLTQVSVRWTAGLSEMERTALERQFSLSDGEPHSDHSDDMNVWNYALNDVSEENIGALVTHAQVVDTNDIDRTRFSVSPQPPRSDHPYLAVQHVPFAQYPGAAFFFAAAAAVWALGFVLPVALSSARGEALAASFRAAMEVPFYRHALAYALFMIPFALWLARPTLSPLALAPVLPAGRVATPGEMFAQMRCVTSPEMPARFAEELATLPERTTCPPDAGLVAWVNDHVPVDGVLAIDRWDPYPAPMFFPQQAVVFPTLDASFIQEDELFRGYYRFFHERMQRHGVQPFFNTVETVDERLAFINGLGVTHVLVNPSHYDMLRPVLDSQPGVFRLRYDNAKWAVYEVIAPQNPLPAV